MGVSYALLVAAAALIALAGLAAMVDSALTEVSPARSAELAEQHRRGAPVLVRITEDLPKYLNLLILLRVACEAAAIALVAVVAFETWDESWAAVAVAAAIMTVVSFVAIGVGPRTIGRQHAYPIALAASGPVYLLGVALGPLARLLILVGNAVTPGRGFREGPFATSQIEIREMVDAAEASGTVDHDERDMIESVFALGDTVAREVMVPRTAMVWVDSDVSAAEAEQVALRSGFSRIPVVGEDLDDVRGVAYLKDLARLEAGVNPPVSEVMRSVSFVPDSKPVDDLLREMQTARIHIAMVVDEYGGTAGLVTIEDILEEIVGEITDEYDNELPPVAWLDDRTARVTARLSVEDLAELFAVDLPEADVDTVAGLLARELGKVPLAGDRALLAGLELTAEGTVGRRNRIETVRISRLPEADDTAARDAAATNDERHKINV
ncbi:hemolysin family protein [Glycomyces buryatensis]|uniref:HlyC/CorC family transporter n=1 Tax=Glycomyces buryatensis TaxID=2570927 RepID=A0A4S8QIE7_9ACTN|nr:hemolysin family protein [Glycomyces buryatensis]THV41159.1 HlyC/CorC family transporter [Glycomyces buryatensis]